LVGGASSAPYGRGSVPVYSHRREPLVYTRGSLEQQHGTVIVGALYYLGRKWLGHANVVSTTRLYDRRKTRPEDTPTFHVKY